MFILNKKKAFIFNIVLAVFNAVLLTQGTFIQNFFHLKNPFLIFVFIFCLSFFIFRFCLFHHFSKSDIITAFFAFIFALSQVIGASFVANGTVYFNDVTLYSNILAFSILCFGALKCLYDFIETHDLQKYSFKFKKRKYWIPFLIIFLLILLAYLPAFFASYPALYYYDGPLSVYSIFHDNEICAHYPILYTFFITGFMYLGNLLFHSYNIGLAMYSIAVLLIFALSFSYAMIKLITYNIPKMIIIFSVAFIALNPMLQIVLFSTTKESLFCSIFLLLLIFTIDMVRDIQNFFKHKLYIARYIITVFMMALLKNQGFYIILAMLPFSLLIIKKYKLKTLALLSACVLCVFIFQGPISNALGIVPSPIGEIFSVPLQQIARTLNLNGDSVSEEEKDIIYQFCPKENIKAYIPTISDPVKYYLNYTAVIHNPMQYIKIYLKLGLQNPQIYFDSFLYGMIEYVYMGKTPVNTFSYATALNIKFPDNDPAIIYAKETLQIQNDNLCKWYGEYLDKVKTGSFLQNIPVISLLVNQALPANLILLALGYLIKNKKKQLIFPLMILIIYLGINFIGPVILFRYSFPLIICIPIILSFPFIHTKKTFKER